MAQELIKTMKVKLKKGLSMFAMNAKTGKIFLADYTTHPINKVSTVKIHPGHIYIPALNVKNAERKFTKNVQQFLKQLEDE